nr:MULTISPECIES: type II toxin-antitoxin system PemK/MazF family toxin [unclassified Paracoccus (in: a-proteobacteria)]
MVTVALQGEHGKPRPALVIQADDFAGAASITVLFVTSTLTVTDLRPVGASVMTRACGFEIGRLRVDLRQARRTWRHQVARASGALSGVTFGLLAPDAQAIGRTAKLRGNRLAGGRVAGVVGPVLSEKPNTAFAQLGRIGGGEFLLRHRLIL